MAIRNAVEPRGDTVEAALIRTSEVAALVIWAALWLLDGFFTAAFLATFAGWALYYGWLAHVCISLVQQYFWRVGWRDAVLLVGPIALFNIMTSVTGLWAFLAARTTAQPYAILDMTTVTVPQSKVLFFISVALGVIIAIRAEREMTKLARRLYWQWRAAHAR